MITCLVLTRNVPYFVLPKTSLRHGGGHGCGAPWWDSASHTSGLYRLTADVDRSGTIEGSCAK